MGSQMTDGMARLAAKDAVIDVLNTLFIGTDQRDWAKVRDCFADSVRFDMTSLLGGRPSDLSPETIVDGWRQGLQAITQVHHQVGNYRVDVDGAVAVASCYGIALHYRKTTSGRNTRTFVGSYDFHLVEAEGRWRIDLFRFNVKFVDGNLDLEKD